MTHKRPVLLMAFLLLVLGVYLARPWLQGTRLGAYLGSGVVRPSAATTPLAPALPGTTSISNLRISEKPDGRRAVEFDYFYTGDPPAALLEVHQVVNSSAEPTPRSYAVTTIGLQRGAHHYSVDLTNPAPWSMSVTTQVSATIRARPGPLPVPPPLARAELSQRIQWPDPVVAEVERAIAAGSTDAIITKAVALIDTGSLKEARAMLQALVERRPAIEMAHVELARVAMKSNWSPQGLREAEDLIGSALRINPRSANAKILLAYVLAHQGRFKEAEPLLVEASQSNPPNLYLWANWGELLAMQGKVDAAIAKYREAITRPPTRDTYDRARHDAYENLMRLLDRRGDLDQLEVLFRQRSQEYPDTGCFAVEYARFLAIHRADPERANSTLRTSAAPQCDATRIREVQGLAYYVSWASAAEPGGAESLMRARAMLPSGPRLFYALASSDRTTPIAQKLIAAGDKLDARDSNGYDALGYALYAGEAPVARRLLRLGAKPAAEVGPERMPAALIPVMRRDFESIRLMQRAGIDYSTLSYRGTTAIEHARSSGDNKLLSLLDPKSGRI